ncbi:hypothetical protein V1511DRAFT_17701 [Dipodascopsis uninucleata]
MKGTFNLRRLRHLDLTVLKNYRGINLQIASFSRQYSDKSEKAPQNEETHIAGPYSRETATDRSQTSESESNSTFDKEDVGYLVRRLEQLAAEATPLKDDPVVGKTGALDDDPLLKLRNRLAQRQFDDDNATILAAAKVPGYAGKHSRDIAFSRPWSGTESVVDGAFRMLNDSNKQLKIPAKSSRRDIGVIRPPDLKRKTTSPQSVRLGRAKELSLEYTIAKNTGALDKMDKQARENKGSFERDSTFKRLYEERFKEVRVMPNTLHGLRALADERIEEARARGQFRDLPRGQPLDIDVRAASPFLDTTEFLLNRIIQKQDIAPPWIDKQQTIRSDIRRFRLEIRDNWKRHAMRIIASEGGDIEEQMARAREYALAENKDENEHRDSKPRKRLPRKDWETIEKTYHELSVKTLNDSIRSYNLMAPEPARWGYLTLERELSMCYAEVVPKLAESLKQRYDLIKSGRTVFNISRKESSKVMNKLFGEKVAVMEKRGNEYGLKEMFRDLIFRRRNRTT